MAKRIVKSEPQPSRDTTEARSHLTRHDEVLILTLSGSLTQVAFEAAIDRVSREARPVALVIDLTRAELQSDWDDEMGALEQFSRASGVVCGMVVPESMLLYMRAQCFRVAAQGIVWLGFLYMEHALEWADSWRNFPLRKFRPTQPTPPLRYEHPAPTLLQ